MSLKADDLKRGKTYRGKRPRRYTWPKPHYNDRTILWLDLGRGQVQYDGPAVPWGRRFPVCSIKSFLDWASHEVQSGDE